MVPSSEGRVYAPGLPAEARWAIRWVSTNNPFYVISAGLFLAGLWLSFGDPDKAEDTWARMAGLTAYTVLLAGTAVLLIRFAKVWDDARTVLLLVILMFLATSVTFDHVLVFDRKFGPGSIPFRGIACNLAGLVLAIFVSEALLRAVRLALPIFYRVPYYLLLSLFFLYPLMLTPFIRRNERPGEDMMWGLFAFSSVAALIFLTLLPAIRVGAEYVRQNGSPWPWPFYPWALFGLLALAVPGRAILLCYSMHLIDVRNLYDMTFGPYFLVPFGLVGAVLLLEAGLVSRRAGVLLAALLMPIGLIGLALVGHRNEEVYQQFLDKFTYRIGADPVFCTLLASAGFYGYAAIRRVPWSVEVLTAALSLMTFIHPRILTERDFVAPQPAPMIAAATLLLGLGIWRRVSWRCLFGSLGLIAGLTLSIAAEVQIAPYRWLIAFHLMLLTIAIIAAAFDDELARVLRYIGPGFVLLGCLAALILPIRLPINLPGWAIGLYPLAMSVLLAAYGFWLRHPPTLAMAGLLITGWAIGWGWQIYRALRSLVVGMDYLVLSLCVFAVAILVSLGKAGILSRWLSTWRRKPSDSAD